MKCGVHGGERSFPPDQFATHRIRWLPIRAILF